MLEQKNKRQHTIDQVVSQPYKYGFSTEIENERIPVGLGESTICLLSKKNDEPDFILDARLKALQIWQNLTFTLLDTVHKLCCHVTKVSREIVPWHSTGPHMCPFPKHGFSVSEKG